MEQNKTGSFLVRISQEELDAFNKAVQSNAVNRSALIRNWIREYIKEEGKRK